MPIRESIRAIGRTVMKAVLGEQRFRAMQNVRRIATSYERGLSEPLGVKLFAWHRGFRARSVLMYDRASVIAGHYVNDVQRDFECSRLNTLPGLLKHKLLLRNVLAAGGVKGPELIAFAWEFGVILHTEQPARRTSPEELTEIVLRDRGRFIWKPEDGGQGKAIVRVEVRNGQLVAIRGNAATPFAFKCARRQACLLERVVEQHPFWAAFAPESLNTLRIHTMWTPGDESPFVGYAVQRMGVRATAPTDNWSGGGILVWIDVDTGVMRTGKTKRLEMFAAHPETGAQIEGVALPYWDTIVEFSLKAARCVPSESYVAWDIAIGADGTPLMIEGNDNAGIDAIQQHVGFLTVPRMRRFFEKTGVI